MVQVMPDKRKTQARAFDYLLQALLRTPSATQGYHMPCI